MTVQKRARVHSSAQAPHVSSSSPAAVPPTRYLFFGGKGGVGKTTAASAAALYLLQHARHDERILLFSTDPAHSLSDSLGIEIGNQLVEVARHGTALLIAREMDASAALAQFRAEHRAVLAEIVERGTFLDESDVNELMDLSLPGMDEVMALFELSEFERTGNYTHIIVDTAPSGHTTRLLRMPEVFSHWIAALDRLAEKHRYIVASFARGRRTREDEVDVFLRELAERVLRARSMLYDEARTSFTLVTIPEAMSVEETCRYFDLLRAEGVPVTDLIINRIERAHNKCRSCCARATEQKPWLDRLAHEFSTLHLHQMPLQSEEVRGLDALRHFANVAWGSPEANTSKKSHAANLKTRPQFKNSPSDLNFAVERRRVLVFGGKGGVGKTTAAAATALALAESDSQSRVLIFSTDPAHSLSDSFEEPVGELKRGVAGCQNLDAMEINPVARFEELKERYRTWTDEVFASLSGNSRWEIQYDREAMRELIALAPPGMDEIAALSTLCNLINKRSYTSIVLDTAPTGHLVRFLELPGVALSWVRTFIKLLLKYKNVVQWNGIAEELVALSKNIKQLSALLTDVTECEFVGVAIPEHMSLEETTRLAGALEELKVPMRRLLINNVVPTQAAAVCDSCAARRRVQEDVIETFRQRLSGSVKVLIAPQQPHEVKGHMRLHDHFAHWQILGDLSQV